MSSSLRDLYAAKCSELEIKANSGLLRYFSSFETPESLQYLTLYGNVVGSRGLLPVLSVAERCPRLISLDLRGNNLTADCVKDIRNVAVHHPTLLYIDLRDNCIQLAGPDLVDLVKRNRRILHLHLDVTQLRPLFMRLIESQLKKNISRAPAQALDAIKAIPECTIQQFVMEGENTAQLWDEFLQNMRETAGQGIYPSTWEKFTFGEAESSIENLQDNLASFGSFRLFQGNEYYEQEKVNDDDDDKEQEDNGTTNNSDEGAPKNESSFGGNFCAFQGEGSLVKDLSRELTREGSCAPPAAALKRGAGRRPTVFAEVITQDEIQNFVPEVFSKENSTRDTLLAILEKDNLFCHLEDYELYVAVDQLSEVTRAKDDVLYYEGDDDCDIFYILYEGEVQLTRVEGKGPVIVGPGSILASVMLLYSGAHEETATCLQACKFYVMNRSAYKAIVTQSSQKKRQTYEGFLSGVGFLKGLPKNEILQLADALKSKKYAPGEKLIKYGEPGLHFFIICEGTVDVLGRDEQMQPKWVCDFSVGDYVGELEFINNHECVADVVAKTAVRVAVMNRHHFELVMGPVKELLARIASESTVYEYYRTQLAEMREKGEVKA